jgi:tRNA uridine 5-carbamoylmethylation protein Kti12
VPTEAYIKAWKTLQEHNFVVLEGPPEMGKTAIAWMIAITLLSQGWQAIACDNPEDFFANYDEVKSQVFVADDAFGRTEYDPTRGKRWENQLHRVLHKTNKNHFLIWTSRKHILERAMQSMDLQTRTRTFPHPANVLVDASRLSIKEKALILYRHARSANFEDDIRLLVKSNAKSIVMHQFFTPERIRRFIKDVAPELLSEMRNGKLDIISQEISKAIKTPTERMTKSFRALTKSHKVLLFSLLEAGNRPKSSVVKSLYETHGAFLKEQMSFEDALDELFESFVKEN